jgi:large subunit ribosomal protein L13
VDTLSYKTVHANKQTVQHKWYVIDAEGEIVGRLCTKIATILRGKNKPSYTPHADAGDFVIVLNADKVRFTGQKMQDKVYRHYTGYPGGQKTYTAQELMARKPNDIVERAVKGMLPKNRLGRSMIKKLFIYTGAEHPHQAQKPEVLG